MSNARVAPGVALVIVTYKREDLLAGLFDSLRRSNRWPEQLIVVDNAAAQKVASKVSELVADLPGTSCSYLDPGENLGGAGGFAAGLEKAHALGAEWIWVMDDDVEILPDGLDALLAQAPGHGAILGRRQDHASNPFFWQQRFNTWLATPIPIPGNIFKNAPEWPTNCGCFEGMFIHRDVVSKVGLPDPRFFITWDDTVYGWLVSLHFPVACVDAFTLRKVRAQRQISVGYRHFNDSSDLSRFHAIKNRALVRHYLRANGHDHPVGFAIGDGLNFAKELARMLLVERSLAGWSSLTRGLKAAREFERELRAESKSGQR